MTARKRRPGQALWPGLTARDGNQQSWHKHFEVESPIESALPINIGRKFERVIAAVERPFDVTQHCVEPTHVARFGGFTAAGTFDHGVLDEGGELRRDVAAA